MREGEGGGGYYFWDLQTVFFSEKTCFKQFLLHFVIETIFYDHFEERILRLF